MLKIAFFFILLSQIFALNTRATQAAASPIAIVSPAHPMVPPIITNPVEACPCTSPLSAYDEEWNSNLVFAGTVTGIVKDSTTNGYDISFNVLHTFKGLLYSTRTIVSPVACGFSFTVGDSYMVYAIGTTAHLTTKNCSRTGSLSSAALDMINLWVC